MPDTENTEGGSIHEDLGAGEKSGGSPHAPGGGTDQGTAGSPAPPGSSLECPEGSWGALEGILQALTSEPSVDVRKDLVAALAKVVELDERRQELAVAVSAEYDLAELRADEEVAKAGRSELLHSSKRVTAMWAAPALFAFGLGIMLFCFLKWQMKEAAEVIREMLVLLLTGALGWAAGRRYGGGEC